MPLLPFYNFRESLLNIAIAILLPAIALLSGKIITQGSDPIEQHKTTSDAISKEKTEHQEAKKNLHLFYIAAIIGIAGLAFGMFSQLSSLNTGFIIGGFTSLSLGYLLYWSQLNNIPKLLILLGIFFIIMFISYRSKNVYIKEQ